MSERGKSSMKRGPYYKFPVFPPGFNSNPTDTSLYNLKRIKKEVTESRIIPGESQKIDEISDDFDDISSGNIEKIDEISPGLNTSVEFYESYTGPVRTESDLLKISHGTADTEIIPTQIISESPDVPCAQMKYSSDSVDSEAQARDDDEGSPFSIDFLRECVTLFINTKSRIYGERLSSMLERKEESYTLSSAEVHELMLICLYARDHTKKN
jgi:hypothetical protein